MGITKMCFVVDQRTLLWQPVKLGRLRKHRLERPLLFASAFDNGLAHRKSAFNSFNGNNQSTSCPNVVNIRSIILEFLLLKRANFAAIRPQFDDDLHSSRWRLQTDWNIAINCSLSIAGGAVAPAPC